MELLLRVNAEFGEERRSLVLKSLEKKTGVDIAYDLKLVDRIDTSEMGKGVYLKQEIQLDS